MQRIRNGWALLAFSLEADPQRTLTKLSIMPTVSIVTGDSRPSKTHWKGKKKGNSVTGSVMFSKTVSRHLWKADRPHGRVLRKSSNLNHSGSSSGEKNCWGCNYTQLEQPPHSKNLAYGNIWRMCWILTLRLKQQHCICQKEISITHGPVKGQYKHSTAKFIHLLNYVYRYTKACTVSIIKLNMKHSLSYFYVMTLWLTFCF